MISITFGLGTIAGSGGFFPESDFTVELNEDTVSLSVESDNLLLVLEEDNITLEVVA